MTSGAALLRGGPARRNRCSCSHCGHPNSYPRTQAGPLRHRRLAIENYTPHRLDVPACRLDKKPDAKDQAREVAIAKAWTGRAYREITLLAHQLHGGAGYVVEHSLHRHTLRAKQAELLFGSTEEWLEDLAGRLDLAPPA